MGKPSDSSGYWYMSAGRSNDLKTTVGFVCRYDCLLGPVRIELHRTELGALIVQTHVKRWRKWQQKESVIVIPSGTTVRPAEWTSVQTWLKDYMDATSTVYGSWRLVVKRWLLA